MREFPTQKTDSIMHVEYLLLANIIKDLYIVLSPGYRFSALFMWDRTD
jgi:hypothetical protein